MKENGDVTQFKKSLKLATIKCIVLFYSLTLSHTNTMSQIHDNMLY
jgi:hypothetical protein